MCTIQSPFVTAVGGTDFETATTLGPEVGWSGSGGGFSNVFARPAYQREAVERYLAEAAKAGVLPPSHLYNASGSSRAYPDISALGGEQNGYCVRAAATAAAAGPAKHAPPVSAPRAHMHLPPRQRGRTLTLCRVGA